MTLLTKLPIKFRKDVNLKKQHEILYFSRLIHYNCLLQNISVIVDLGTGLGYICQLLNYLYGYKILALDSSHLNIDKAKLRQQNFFPDSISTIKYICTNITADSDKFIESTLEKEFKEKKKCCLIGLHACGDLSIHASNMHLKMKIARLLVLVSCCYHKLSYEEINRNNMYINRKEYFKYFPLSNEFKNTIRLLCIDTGNLLKRTFLRLASQETSDRWFTIDKTSHNNHSLYTLSRAVLELYAYNNNLKIKKVIRKGTRKSHCLNFKDYLKLAMVCYEYEKTNDDNLSVIKFLWTHEVERNILSLWDRNYEKLYMIEPYTALQMVLQNVVESLVLIDRMHFLKEQNCNPVLFPVTDRSLSPRSFALISNKIT
ncbi:methyltransferase-like protein 25B isoform X2 [Phymastichus coffea]|nr:methyltransferase-like protein 25B isoform X2 [Phymastichus coffea]